MSKTKIHHKLGLTHSLRLLFKDKHNKNKLIILGEGIA